jgi:hypothetical protein
MCTFSPLTPLITRARMPDGNGKGRRLAISVLTIAARAA